MWRRRTGEDFDRELEAHVAIETDRLIAEGRDPAAARAAALRAFGNVTRARERYFESRRVMWLEGLRRDVQYAIRTLARTPAFTAVALITVALGTGATTAIFSVVHSVLLRPLPYRDADRLVTLHRNESAAESSTKAPRRVPVSLSVPEMVELRARSRSITHAGASTFSFMMMTGGGAESARLQGSRVSPALFAMLGVPPRLGRVFDTADEAPGAPPVVILSEATWRQHFGADPDVIGRTVSLANVLARPRPDGTLPADGSAHTIVGVMPESFEPDGQTQFWTAFAQPASGPAPRAGVMMRLAGGVSLDAAAAELGGIVDSIQARPARPAEAGGPPRYELERRQEGTVATVKPALLVLMGAVLLVLMIVCVNVANLVLARTSSRQREIAVRLALGASRGRVIRHLLSETLTLALAGGAAGVLLAVGGIKGLRVLAATFSRLDLGVQLPFPRLAEISIDGTVLAFAIAVTVATGIVCGVVPAVRHSRDDRLDALRESAATAYSGFSLRGRHRMRGALIVAEVAMAMMLLVGAGLLIGSFVKLSSVDLGYDPEHVVTFQVALPPDRYPQVQLRAFAEGLVTRLQSAPGVQAAAYGRQVPFIAIRESAWFRRTPVLPTPPPQQPSGAPDARLVSRHYFETLGIRVVDGRGFAEGDGAGRPRVMVVNEALARNEFPGQRAVGQIVYAGRTPEPWEIVGVVRDVRQAGQDQEPQPQFFADFRQWSEADSMLFTFLGPYYAVRLRPDSGAVEVDRAIAHVRAAARELDSQAGIFNVAPMDRIVSNRVSRPRLYAVLVGVFAALALSLAAVGIYGVIGYAVAERTREIGVRMALGAQRRDVMKLVLGQSALLTMAGIVVGLAGAAALTRCLEGMLYGLTPLDPSTFAGVAVLFLVIAAVAAYLPARRATRVDPLMALRAQ